MATLSPRKFIHQTYQKLYKAFGAQSWWPGETPFEVIVGAILTQNTNWKNVEKAIVNLKFHLKPFGPLTLHQLTTTELAKLIKPAGYFNVKAKRLNNFLDFLFKEYDGQIEKMKKEDLGTLRKKLLGVNGIGPETADSILLYALDKPIFVVDAYTKRFLYRHNMIGLNEDYHDVQKVFSSVLKKDVQKFNEYHALIVRLGKGFCKTKPNCQTCVLNRLNYSVDHQCAHCHRHLADGKVCRTCQPDKRINLPKS